MSQAQKIENRKNPLSEAGLDRVCVVVVVVVVVVVGMGSAVFLSGS